MIQMRRTPPRAPFAAVFYPTGTEEDYGAIVKSREDIGDYESGLSRLLDAHLTSDGFFLDIGAQIGLFSILAALRGARVLSLEMRTSLVFAHYMTRRANNLGNWLPMNVAIDENFGVIPYNEQFQAALVGNNASLREASDTALAVRIDELPPFMLGDANACIKMDVEGFEVRALRGMTNYLARSRPLAFVECHPHFAHLYDANIAEIPTLFPSDYDFYVLEDHRSEAGIGLRKIVEVTHIADNFLLVCTPRERSDRLESVGEFQS